MKIFVPREVRANENRVALVPESCKKLIQAGIEVAIEAGAGERASYPDSAYAEVGAQVEPDSARLLAEADLVLELGAPGMRPDGRHEADLIKSGAMFLGSLFPTRNLEAVKKLAARGVTAFSTDCIPRTTRAQKLGWLARSVARSATSAVLPRSAILHARPAAETAFLVDAAARRAPHKGRGDALLSVLAQLEARDRAKRGVDVPGAAT